MRSIALPLELFLNTFYLSICVCLPPCGGLRKMKLDCVRYTGSGSTVAQDLDLLAPRVSTAFPPVHVLCCRQSARPREEPEAPEMNGLRQARRMCTSLLARGSALELLPRHLVGSLSSVSLPGWTGQLQRERTGSVRWTVPIRTFSDSPTPAPKKKL